MKLPSDGVAVVTGAASGIGLALAGALGDAGMQVVLTDIDASRLAQAATMLQARGHDPRTVVGDVSDREHVTALAETAFGLGPVRVVCSNAGVVVPGLSWELSAEQWDRVLGIDLMATIHLQRAFLPRLVAAGEPAHLLITGSMASVTARAGIAPYVCAKHALLGLAECLAAELESVGAAVGVTLLMPGQVASGMTAAAQDGLMTSQRVAEIALAAVEDDRLFAFTHPDRMAEVERRFAGITAQRPPG